MSIIAVVLTIALVVAFVAIMLGLAYGRVAFDVLVLLTLVLILLGGV